MDVWVRVGFQHLALFIDGDSVAVCVVENRTWGVGGWRGVEGDETVASSVSCWTFTPSKHFPLPRVKYRRRKRKWKEIMIILIILI